MFTNIMNVVWAVVILIVILLGVEQCNLQNKPLVSALEDGEIQLAPDGYTPFTLSFHFYGIEEFPGLRHNVVITNFFKDLRARVYDDETSWCSAFMNAMAIRTGYEFSNSLAARSWLNVGEEIRVPRPGDVAVLWRGDRNGWQGHVGFYLRHNKTKSRVLIYGGNQSNAIKPQWYPRYRVLEYRRLSKADTTQTISDELLDFADY